MSVSFLKFALIIALGICAGARAHANAMFDDYDERNRPLGLSGYAFGEVEQWLGGYPIGRVNGADAVLNTISNESGYDLFENPHCAARILDLIERGAYVAKMNVIDSRVARGVSGPVVQIKGTFGDFGPRSGIAGPVRITCSTHPRFHERLNGMVGESLVRHHDHVYPRRRHRTAEVTGPGEEPSSHSNTDNRPYRSGPNLRPRSAEPDCSIRNSVDGRCSR